LLSSPITTENMNREEALKLVRQYVKNENLVHHMLAVEAAMCFYAEKLGQPVETWSVTGLLHDFDWEIHPSAEQHPLEGAPILRQHGVAEEVIQAILAHGQNLNIPRTSLLAKGLYACDEITGLITAVALCALLAHFMILKPVQSRRSGRIRLSPQEPTAKRLLAALKNLVSRCGSIARM